MHLPVPQRGFPSPCPARTPKSDPRRVVLLSRFDSYRHRGLLARHVFLRHELLNPPVDHVLLRLRLDVFGWFVGSPPSPGKWPRQESSQTGENHRRELHSRLQSPVLRWACNITKLNELFVSEGNSHTRISEAFRRLLQ